MVTNHKMIKSSKNLLLLAGASLAVAGTSFVVAGTTDVLPQLTLTAHAATTDASQNIPLVVKSDTGTTDGAYLNNDAECQDFSGIIVPDGQTIYGTVAKTNISVEVNYQNSNYWVYGSAVKEADGVTDPTEDANYGVPSNNSNSSSASSSSTSDSSAASSSNAGSSAASSAADSSAASGANSSAVTSNNGSTASSEVAATPSLNTASSSNSVAAPAAAVTLSSNANSATPAATATNLATSATASTNNTASKLPQTSEATKTSLLASLLGLLGLSFAFGVSRRQRNN